MLGFTAACELPPAAVSGGYSLLQCTGFSRRQLPLLRSTGSGVQASVVVCGTWGQLLRGMWDLPRPGIEPMSPALAGGFQSTVPPGKLSASFLKVIFSSVQFTYSVVSDCDPMDCSTPGFPIHHQLPELTQTHVH